MNDPVLTSLSQSATPYQGPSNARTDMEETIISCDGVDYTEDEIIHLISEIKDYQLTHGSLLKTVQYETESSVPARPVGVSILPTSFPTKMFNEALMLQQTFNELYIRVACDPDWLHAVLGPLIERDPFIAALWSVYEEVRDAGAIQDVVCGVFRSDYMLHQPLPDSGDAPAELKQVEINTFSAAGACHAERIGNMHRLVGQQVRGLTVVDAALKFPFTENTASLVRLLTAAQTSYIISDTSHVEYRRQCVLIPVQSFNFNIADERPIQYGLLGAGTPCYRCEWQRLLERTTLHDDNTLLYHPPVGGEVLEVTVIYYRAGYEAFEYDEQGRAARLRLEMSRAIKCPDVLTHMTNMKAVQQALSAPGALQRFLLEHDKCEALRKTFMPMQILDVSVEGLKAREIAQDPEQAQNYVLKPNRDGGGHNIYRSDIPPFLADIPAESWRNYVLMRLIEPPPTTGVLMMPEELYVGDVVSELGILGTCLWRRSTDDADGGTKVEVIRNEAAGWTFKTKPVDVDEMSVVKGYGCFDCPLLVG